MDHKQQEVSAKTDAEDASTTSLENKNCDSEKVQNSDHLNDWKATEAEDESGTVKEGKDTEKVTKIESSPSSLFSLKVHLTKSTSGATCTTNPSSSSQQSIDCADIILNCLFCQFYEMIFMIPNSCERLTNHCCPNYKHVITTMESTDSGDNDSWTGLDCGICTSCHDASDCLELAMEISEICYH